MAVLPTSSLVAGIGTLHTWLTFVGRCQLDGQFRCAGSGDFIRWVDATLGIADANPSGSLMDNLTSEAVRGEANGGYSARLVVCAPQKLEPRRFGRTLLHPVQRRPTPVLGCR